MEQNQNNGRDIKFRAWDTKNKRWLEFVPPREYMLDSEEWSHHDIDEEASLFFPNNPLASSFNGRIVYQQYTGCKDKNKKEIYEGDIIKYSNSESEKEKGIVEFEEGCFTVRSLSIGDTHTVNFIIGVNGKVIGNIFENPELTNENLEKKSSNS